MTDTAPPWQGAFREWHRARYSNGSPAYLGAPESGLAWDAFAAGWQARGEHDRQQDNAIAPRST